MQQRKPPTAKLSDFKGKPVRVTATPKADDQTDITGTYDMLERYTDKDGFHCPRCSFITSDREQAVYHLEEEINKALAKLGT